MRAQMLLPSISDLLAFQSAARYASFTRAAEELNLTPSAVSRAIRILEDRLGVALFERIRQRVVLTTAGALYLKDIEAVLSDLREATHRTIASAGSSVLNIAVLPTFGERWLSPRLPEFTARWPNVTLNFASRLQPFSFREEIFDGAIHYGSPSWPGALVHWLMEEEIVPVASPWLMRTKGIVEASDLRRTTLLHQSTRPTAWADWFAAQGLDDEAVLQGPRYEQFSMLARAAAAGVGVALVPRLLVEDELNACQLQIVPGDRVPATGAYYWVVPEDKAASPSLHDFTTWIVDSAHNGTGPQMRAPSDSAS